MEAQLPASPDRPGSRLAGQCQVTIANLSEFPIEVSWTALSGSTQRTVHMGALRGRDASTIAVACGESVVASGTAMGKSDQGSAVATRERTARITLKIEP